MITTPMDPERARWIDTGIEPRWRGITLAELTTSAPADGPYSLACALQIAREYVAGLDEQQELTPQGVPVHRHRYGRGLLITGLPGTGKTTLAAGLLCDIRRSHRSVYMIRYPDLVEHERMLITTQLSAEPDDISRATHALDRARAVDVLCLDAVGLEHITASRWSQDSLERRLRGRFERGQPTILTTSLPGDEWAARYSGSLRSFVAEACRIIAVTGPDLRQENR